VVLDQHAARFGSGGALVAEANGTRIEALLRLGRRDQALALLDPMALPPSRRGQEMLLTRAELRSQAGRCADALIDFDLLRGGAPAPVGAVMERVLYGRASCRARGGDVAGSRADLQSYLYLFPEGKFAAQARQALKR
jgi:hypothetical protein